MDDTMTGKAVADGAAPMQNAAGQNEAGQNKAGHDKAGHNEAGAKGAAGGAAPKRKQALPLLALGSLGVVFGDIGTSPLYALRQVFHDNPPLAHEPASVIGILSLIIWAVALAVCVKYTLLVMRADNDGEGGTLAMLGLIEKSDPPKPRVGPSVLVLLVLFGSALLYGDGVITPSISVLSAVEGLGVATSALKPVVLPLSVIILVALFLVQSRGTAAVGKLFGPVMLLWFSAIGGLGAWSLWQTPAILQCLNPVTGLAFLTHHGWQGYATLGAVVLAFSGVEALFADMGHFGRAPIVLAWYFVCLPGLVLNYLGEGALLLRDPHAGAEPFFGLVPHVALYPMVALSTAATVIASQALISGVFSLTQQAVNMGLAPPYRILHTSQDTSGQVYMPLINVLLMIGCVAIVLAFRSSDALGNAYGLAVIGTMTVTSIVFFIVMRRVWRWHLLVALPIMLAFLVFDVSFLGANLIKLLEGAWVPLAIGLCIFLLLWCWTLGRARFARALMQWAMPIEEFQRGIGAAGWHAGVHDHGAGPRAADRQARLAARQLRLCAGAFVACGDDAVGLCARGGPGGDRRSGRWAVHGGDAVRVHGIAARGRRIAGGFAVSLGGDGVRAGAADCFRRVFVCGADCAFGVYVLAAHGAVAERAVSIAAQPDDFRGDGAGDLAAGTRCFLKTRTETLFHFSSSAINSSIIIVPFAWANVRWPAFATGMRRVFGTVSMRRARKLSRRCSGS
jgi:KUP system potassium uptake protein